MNAFVIECASSFRVTVLPGDRVRIEVEDAALQGAPEEPSLTREQAAEFLKVSIRTLNNYRQRRKNPVPCHVRGGRPTFYKSELQAWRLGSPKLFSHV